MNAVKIILHTLYLVFIWLILSGYYNDPVLVILGAISALLVVYLLHAMKIYDFESVSLFYLLVVLFILPRLLIEIVKSSLKVIKIALFQQEEELKTRVFVVHVPRYFLQSEMKQLLLAQFTTLTPGTISIKAPEPNVIVVHALYATEQELHQDINQTTLIIENKFNAIRSIIPKSIR